MLRKTDAFLEWSGLQVKETKCATFYERRSGGNRWYRAKSDQLPQFKIGDKPIRVYERKETYMYLGHRFNVAGEWDEQVQDIISEYTNRVQKIDESPLPLTMKLEAIRQIALAKVQHLFANVHIPRNILREMNNKTVATVRRWLGLNSHTTRDFIHHSAREGGLGVPDIEWTYISTRLAHLVQMLNNDDQTVREMARASLFLDMKKRKVPQAKETEPSFLGFRRKSNGKLDVRAVGFGVRSDWPDLNDLCNWCGVNLHWSQPGPVDEITTIKSATTTVSATFVEDGERALLPICSRASLLSRKHQQRKAHWTGLKMQGKLACIPSADQSVSHSIFKNASIDEDIQVFTAKSRLQVLPTRFNLSVWYPNTFSPFCIHHGQTQVIIHVTCTEWLHIL